MVNKSKKKVVLVTGATGFIGRHLTNRLLSSQKYLVFAASRFPQKEKDLKSRGVKFFKADITNKEDLKKFNKFQIDIIVHCAACLGKKSSKKNLNKTNIEGTENVCKLAVELGVERLIYISSVAVVSGNRQVPLTEDLPYSATSRYGYSKLEAEKKVLTYLKKGVPIIILRPPIVYGEDEPHFSPVLFKLLKYRLVPLVNGGRAKFHLAYVGNVVEAIIFSLEKQGMFEGPFFVADKEVLTSAEVFKSMANGLGVKPPFSLSRFWTAIFSNLPFLGWRLRFFLKNRQYSTKKIESLGFKPPYAAKDALIKSAKNFYNHKAKSDK